VLLSLQAVFKLQVRPHVQTRPTFRALDALLARCHPDRDATDLLPASHSFHPVPSDPCQPSTPPPPSFILPSRHCLATKLLRRVCLKPHLAPVYRQKQIAVLLLRGHEDSVLTIGDWVRHTLIVASIMYTYEACSASSCFHFNNLTQHVHRPQASQLSTRPACHRVLASASPPVHHCIREEISSFPSHRPSSKLSTAVIARRKPSKSMAESIEPDSGRHWQLPGASRHFVMT
jgi:hypothetical protein